MKKIIALVIGILFIAGSVYAAGTLLVDGRIGLGTTDPQYKFHMHGDPNRNWVWLQATTRNTGTGPLDGFFWGIEWDNSAQFWSEPGMPIVMVSGGQYQSVTRFNPDGSVTMGNYWQQGGGYKLYVEGSVFATGGYDQPSDIKLKENISPIGSALDKVMQINGVSFNWKKDKNKDRKFPEGRDYGVIGQEVEKVLPEIVKQGPDGEKTVSYTKLIPVLIEAIKEQQKAMSEMKEEIKELKREIKLKNSVAMAETD